MPLQSSKEPPESQAKVPEPAQGEPDYRYEFDKAWVGTNPEGERYQVMRLAVIKVGKEVGYMTIWHNRHGAFAHFVDTTTR